MRGCLSAIKKTNQPINESYPNLAVFLLRRGLLGIQPSSDKLINISFDTVYKLLERSELDWSLWTELDQLLPRLFYVFDWDRCERLRRGVVDSYIKNSLPSKSFTDITKRDDVIRSIKSSATHVRDGRMFYKDAVGLGTKYKGFDER